MHHQMPRRPFQDICGDTVIHGRKGPSLALLPIYEAEVLFTAELTGHQLPAPSVIILQVAGPAIDIMRQRISARTETRPRIIIERVHAAMFNSTFPLEKASVRDPASIPRNRVLQRWRRRRRRRKYERR